MFNICLAWNSNCQLTRGCTLRLRCSFWTPRFCLSFSVTKGARTGSVPDLRWWRVELPVRLCQGCSLSLDWVRRQLLTCVRVVRSHWTGFCVRAVRCHWTRFGDTHSLVSGLFAVTGLDLETPTHLCQGCSQSLNWIWRHPLTCVRAVRSHWTGFGDTHSLVSGLFAVIGLGLETPTHLCQGCSQSLDWIWRHPLTCVRVVRSH